LHFVGYAVLFISVKAAYGAQSGNLALLALLFAYSALIEVGQHFVPQRHFDVRDMAANLLGLMAGLGLVVCGAKLRALAPHLRMKR
jgi:VanZ family protein